MAPRKTATKSTRKFDIPALSANPAERITQLSSLSDRAQEAMKEALTEARDAGQSWSDIAKQTGMPNSTLRRLGGYTPPSAEKAAPAKKTAAKKAPAAKRVAAKKTAPAAKKTAAKKTTTRARKAA